MSNDRHAENPAPEKKELPKEKSAEECAQEYLTRLKYLAAEFDNYKKQMAKEKENWMNAGQTQLIAELIPTLDEFDAALESMKKAPVSNEAVAGVEIVQKNMHRMLREKGLKQVETHGKRFDPHQHEAIAYEAVGEQEPANHILRVIQTGYEINGILIRPAQVVVSKHNAPEKGGKKGEPP
ncbi:nucleotide exchange factor GrpE [Candidatus Micrarchaeota archaeon]|nr:nucleotide exchange factor GrpE [Candidatus Micrarchaeota archaeon]